MEETLGMIHPEAEFRSSSEPSHVLPQCNGGTGGGWTLLLQRGEIRRKKRLMGPKPVENLARQIPWDLGALPGMARSHPQLAGPGLPLWSPPCCAITRQGRRGLWSSVFKRAFIPSCGMTNTSRFSKALTPNAVTSAGLQHTNFGEIQTFSS